MLPAALVGDLTVAGRRRPTLSCATGLSLPLVRDVLREHVRKVRRSSASCLSISNPCSFRALADTRGCLLRRGRMTTMKGVFAIHFVSYESMRWLHPPLHSMTSMRSGSPYLIHVRFAKKLSTAIRYVSCSRLSKLVARGRLAPLAPGKAQSSLVDRSRVWASLVWR